MSPAIANPALLRHRLRTALKNARESEGKTQREVADALFWSVSKVIRIEKGLTGISPSDVKALAGVLEIQDRADVLMEWAHVARRQPFAEYGDLLTPDTRRYYGYEASASIIRSFEPLIMPGLLQTEEYTRALLDKVYALSSSVIEQLVEVRKVRQQVLDPSPDAGEASSEAFFIIPETVLVNPVGGVAVMRAQLEHIAEVARRPRVVVQVLRGNLGAHFGLRGPFVYFEFDDEDAPNVLYLENALGELSLAEDPRVIDAYRTGFQSLEKLASSREDVEVQLKRALDQLGR